MNLGRGSGRKAIYILLVNGFGGDAHEAKTVEDGHFEAAHLGETWVNVKRTVYLVQKKTSADIIFLLCKTECSVFVR